MRVFKKQGITIIEILAVLVILGIIAAIAVPTVNTLIRNTRERANVASLNNYVDAARLHALSFEEDTVTVLASELETTGELFFFLNADGGVGINPINLRFVLIQGVVSEVLLEGSGVAGSDNELWVSNRSDGSQAVRVFFADGVFSRGDDLLFDGSGETTYIQTFEGVLTEIKTAYATQNTFTDGDGFSWFVRARTNLPETTVNDSVILGNAADYSVVRVEAQGGISRFSVQMVRAFTNSNTRTANLVVNGTVIDSFTIHPTDDTVQIFVVENINISGNVTIELRSTSPGVRGAFYVDNFTWTTYTE